MLLGSLGALGAAALLNRVLRDRSPLPIDHVGGVRIPWTWRGYEIFVTERGEGPTVMLVHGIYAGASSFEYRRLAPLLAKRFRVVTFDLLGCGLSEMPDVAYDAELFIEQIVDALGCFADGPVTLVGSSLGGAYAIAAAQRAPDRVRHLVTISPTGLGVLDGDPVWVQRVVQAVFHAPLVGELAFNGLASRSSLRYFLRTQTYADPKWITPETVDAFYAVTHQPGARYVPARFVGGALNCDVADVLPHVDAPLLVLWGEDASSTSPVANAAAFARVGRDVRIETFAGAGLLPHEEEPQAVDEAIERFVRPREESYAAGPKSA